MNKRADERTNETEVLSFIIVLLSLFFLNCCKYSWKIELTPMNNFWKVFYIIKGRVKVTVHKSSAILHTGSTFFVPQGKYFFHFFYS